VPVPFKPPQVHPDETPSAPYSIRLFMAPGMGHCSGGEGPNVFDKVGALNQWVETGKAPDMLPASHVTNGKVDRTGPLCPYPQVANTRARAASTTPRTSSAACRNPPGRQLEIEDSGIFSRERSLAPPLAVSSHMVPLCELSRRGR
jgi:hypothetical protein